ncbi:hypothetical protein ABET51_06830 [Metabacillus fastidiosus]|uniref:hypothetical protein n=1 Tax=Metabacillus fastidiosus TaxID=1458 RepID=UPI003D2E7828
MFIKLLFNIGYDKLEFDAVLVDESHAIYIDGDSVYFLKVRPSDKSNVYENASATATLGEEVEIKDKFKELQQAREKILTISFHDYMTKIYPFGRNDENLGLIK